jgi:hypothetical protein
MSMTESRFVFIREKQRARVRPELEKKGGIALLNNIRKIFKAYEQSVKEL